MDNIKELTEYLEENIPNSFLEDIPAEYVAGLYLQQYGSVKYEDLASGHVDDWARGIFDSQHKYAETIEEFARDLFDDLSEWTDENETFNTLAPHVKWIDVWHAELKHDWVSYQLPDKSYLFVMIL